MGPRAGLDAVKKRKISFPSRKSNPDRTALKAVAIPTKLSELPKKTNEGCKIVKTIMKTMFFNWVTPGYCFFSNA
jgi:hypothetical protein